MFRREALTMLTETLAVRTFRRLSLHMTAMSIRSRHEHSVPSFQVLIQVGGSIHDIRMHSRSRYIVFVFTASQTMGPLIAPSVHVKYLYYTQDGRRCV